ncbi:MAG: GyrI-like domain-containing protein [Vicinamibacteria bacterium]|nr:GyrI-like domain-containing protein [Vicinamibacteria bacterium]
MNTKRENLPPRFMRFAMLLAVSLTPVVAAESPESRTPAPGKGAVAPTSGASEAPSGLPVVVKNVEAIHALVISKKGSYQQHIEAFMRLHGHLESLSKSPLGPPFSRYFNNTIEVEEPDLLWEVGFPVDSSVTAAAPFEIKDIPAGLTATLVYEGPPDDLQAPWPGFIQWTAANGYRTSGPPMMLFLGAPGSDGTMIVELRIPVETIDRP